MLSILLPVYNYNVTKLVQQLHHQATEAGIPFEITCLDDASTNGELQLRNNAINALEHCSFKVLDKNIGRSSIRNLLAKEARYNWLLFLDADTLPVSNNFIKNYLPFLNDGEKVVYGGIIYQKEQPQDNELLRWVYGNEREAIPYNIRTEEPYKSMLTLNFMISKSVFNTVAFNETIPNLRHEDTLFSYNLFQHNIKIGHIDNPVYHLGLETSAVFIKKSEEAVVGLKYLTDHNLLDAGYVRLARVYNLLRKTGLIPVMTLLYKATYKSFRKNLLSNKPSLLIFDLYRLGYLCSLKS